MDDDIDPNNIEGKVFAGVLKAGAILLVINFLLSWLTR